MAWIPKELQAAADDIGEGESVVLTTRDFIWWFGAERRTSGNVYLIRSALDELQLETDPDFESAYLDGEIRLVATQSVASDEEGVGDAEKEGTSRRDVAESAYRVSKLRQANKAPVSVQFDAELKEAITIMMQNDFSQLPVMQSTYKVAGVVSWRSVATRLAMGNTCKTVRDCVEAHAEVKYDDSLFSAIRLITENDCVLVRGGDNKICGIITASDISAQFEDLGEPFLLLGEIENHIRYIIDGAFSADELAEVKDPDDTDRKIAGVWDLTFGEYLRLIEHKERWDKLGINLDRKTFVKSLDRIRRIRNDVMHFDPDGIAPEDMEELRKFAKFLQTLHSLGIQKET